jgi:glycosyltransferase involved in cell wall biosynthesis
MGGGGMETFLFRLGGYLSKKGHRVDVITTLSKGNWHELPSEFGLTPRHIERSKLGGWRFHALRTGLTLRWGGYDCIFLDETTIGHHAIPLFSKKTVVIPVLHRDVPYAHAVAAKNSDLWNVAVAPNAKSRDTLAEEVYGRPVVSIPRGIELPSAGALENRAGFELPLKILYIGRFAELKGVRLLPEILSALVAGRLRIKVKIVGNGSELAKVISRINEYGLQDIVQWVDFVHPSQVYSFYLDSHVMLFPSLSEGFGNAAAEAQACGCVPIANLLPGCTDVTIANDETGFLVENNNLEQYVSAVRQLSENPSLWQKMSTAGRTRTAEKFSIPQMGESFINLINDVRAGKYPSEASRFLSIPRVFLVKAC